MQSVWGVEHGDDVSKGFGDYFQARKKTHKKSVDARKASPAGKNGKMSFTQAADLDGLKKTFTSRSYRKGQTAELKAEYRNAKADRKKKSNG